MGWSRLDHFAQLEAIAEASHMQPQLIFKHSTRCSISAAAKHRLELNLDKLRTQFKLHFLDLILHRDISNGVASRFAVLHESPQVLVIVKGQVVLNITHYDIDPDRILQQASTLKQVLGANPS
jgi:bacillithiol system protein YtxJ